MIISKRVRTAHRRDYSNKINPNRTFMKAKKSSPEIMINEAKFENK